MAKLTGTVTTGDIKGAREDLSDMIYNITPRKTPLMSSIGKGKATGTLHEWQIDTLADPVANAQPEGNEHTFALPGFTTRLGNACQISDKTAIASGTADAVKKAGRGKEMAYQMSKRAPELKRDIETALFANTAASSSDPRVSAGLGAWIKTNDDFGATGASPVYTTFPSAARTDGTQRAVTETMLKNVLQLAWQRGGEPDYVSVGAFVKQAISSFSGVASKVYNLNKAESGTIVASADVYVGEFGTLHVHANRYQRTRDLWVLDREHLGIAFLRPFHSEPLAKTGDAHKRVIRAEWTLEVKNEEAHGLVADLLTA